MATEILKVSRDIYRNPYRGDIRSKFGGTNEINVRLSDDLRYEMAGDAVAFVECDTQNGKRVWLKRVPVPDPAW